MPRSRETFEVKQLRTIKSLVEQTIDPNFDPHNSKNPLYVCSM